MFIEKKYPPERICLWNMETGSWMEIDLIDKSGIYGVAVGHNADYRDVFTGEKQSAIQVYERLKSQWTGNRVIIQIGD